MAALRADAGGDPRRRRAPGEAGRPARLCDLQRARSRRRGGGARVRRRERRATSRACRPPRRCERAHVAERRDARQRRGSSSLDASACNRWFLRRALGAPLNPGEVRSRYSKSARYPSFLGVSPGSRRIESTFFRQEWTKATDGRADLGFRCPGAVAGPWLFRLQRLGDRRLHADHDAHHDRGGDDLPAPRAGAPRARPARHPVAFLPFLALARLGHGDQGVGRDPPQAPRQVRDRGRPAQPADARHQDRAAARQRALSHAKPRTRRRSPSSATARPTTGSSATSIRASAGRASA